MGAQAHRVPWRGAKDLCCWDDSGLNFARGNSHHPFLPRSFIPVRSFPKVRDPITVLAGLTKNKTCAKKAMLHFPSRWEGEVLSGGFVGRYF